MEVLTLPFFCEFKIRIFFNKIYLAAIGLYRFSISSLIGFGKLGSSKNLNVLSVKFIGIKLIIAFLYYPSFYKICSDSLPFFLPF